MANLLNRLVPRSETHLLFALVGGGGLAPMSVAGVEVISIAGAGDSEAGALERFTCENGFPGGWSRDMLDEGASAVVARDAGDGEVLAMSWTIARPFYVEEIEATLDPGKGVYLFGDFVAPNQRGRKLQRLLIHERLQRSAEAPYFCTIIHPTNLASLRSYQNEGFTPAGRFRRTHWLGKTWHRCGAIDEAKVRFRLKGPGTIAASS